MAWKEADSVSVLLQFWGELLGKHSYKHSLGGNNRVEGPRAVLPFIGTAPCCYAGRPHVLSSVGTQWSLQTQWGWPELSVQSLLQRLFLHSLIFCSSWLIFIGFTFLFCFCSNTRAAKICADRYLESSRLHVVSNARGALSGRDLMLGRMTSPEKFNSIKIIQSFSPIRMEWKISTT